MEVNLHSIVMLTALVEQEEKENRGFNLILSVHIANRGLWEERPSWTYRINVFYSCLCCKRRRSPRHFPLIELRPRENVLQQHAECLVHHVQDGWTVTDGTTLKKKHNLLGAKAEMKNKDVERKL